MATQIDAARLLTYRAAWMKDQGQRVTQANRRWRSCSRPRSRCDVCNEARADPRRLRIHQGLSGGEVLPRREALHDRRRHQRDSAAGDRAAAIEKRVADRQRTYRRKSEHRRRVCLRAGFTLQRLLSCSNVSMDLRFTLRSMRRNPGFATLVIVTMALGICANVTVSSLVRRGVPVPPSIS